MDDELVDELATDEEVVVVDSEVVDEEVEAGVVDEVVMDKEDAVVGRELVDGELVDEEVVLFVTGPRLLLVVVTASSPQE